MESGAYWLCRCSLRDNGPRLYFLDKGLTYNKDWACQVRICLRLEACPRACPGACPGSHRDMAQEPLGRLSLYFLLWKGLELKLAQVRRILKVAEVGKGV